MMKLSLVSEATELRPQTVTKFTTELDAKLRAAIERSPKPDWSVGLKLGKSIEVDPQPLRQVRKLVLGLQ